MLVELDELLQNAIGAALDERSLHLRMNLAKLREHPESQSRDFAIEATEAAIRDIVRARLAIAEAIEEPEPPADMTFARMFETESEARLAWGDR